MYSLISILKEIKLNHQDSSRFNDTIMKKIKHITFVLLFSSFTFFGQTKETKKADTYFENLAFASAAEAYKGLAEENPTAHVLKRLGDSYYENVDMQKAASAYEKLFADYTPKEPEYLFRYAQTLRSIGKFEASKMWMEKFHQAKKEDSRGVHFTSKEITLDELRNGNPKYEVTNQRSINTKYSDFGVTDFGYTILFSSPRKSNRFIKRNHSRNDRNFLDIYKVAKDKITTNEEDNLEERQLFSNKVNSKYHESSISFSPDSQTMYFTRNNYVGGAYKVDKKGYNNLKILKAEWVDNKWRNIVELPFNSADYSTGHPSVSKDGKKLYFVSDMPGGIGATDIYVVAINADGSFGAIQNLGSEVNTEGRELFPFISNEEILYFSSDGHFGIGALDVFATKKVKGFYTAPVNLKAPINTELDDFAFSMNPITKNGYLSSNRAGGVGDDDIYAVIELAAPEVVKIPCMQTVLGTVKDKELQKLLPGAKVVLKDAKGEIVKEIFANESAEFTFTLPCNLSYEIMVTKEYYQPNMTFFITPENSKVGLNLNVVLDIVPDFTYNERGESIVKIAPIYFDYNKSNIRADAAIELNKIVSIMNKYPTIVIRSGSHTDARGRASYNAGLSERRANSTVAYIVNKGINVSRISGKGFGEDRLVNDCVDNDGHTDRIKCTKVEHQSNRRTEFVIVTISGNKNQK